MNKAQNKELEKILFRSTSLTPEQKAFLLYFYEEMTKRFPLSSENVEYIYEHKTGFKAPQSFEKHSSVQDYLLYQKHVEKAPQ